VIILDKKGNYIGHLSGKIDEGQFKELINKVK